ncbi:GOLPH3/VPS74 family protein [Occultella glacieicola]|nr:GPP34 family phosphoprotein [Occultella glacieicola]
MSHTLAEEYLLLVLDDDSGRPLIDANSLHTAIAAAALTDLVSDGAPRGGREADGPVRKGRFARTGRSLPADPLRLAILDKAHDRKPKDAVAALGGMFSWSDRAKTLKEQLLEGLAGEGVLEQQESKILGIFRHRRAPGDRRGHRCHDHDVHLSHVQPRGQSPISDGAAAAGEPSG